MDNYTCSFFGHRNTVLTEGQYQKLFAVIEDLICNHGVTTFLFGSKSKFNNICHTIVTKLKDKYTFINRIAYTCKSETCVLDQDKKFWENIYTFAKIAPQNIFGFEAEYECKTRHFAGKASYITRNYAMINNSDYCIFYYNEKYSPQINQHANSGTKIAFNYAKHQKKIIINIFENF